MGDAHMPAVSCPVSLAVLVMMGRLERQPLSRCAVASSAAAAATARSSDGLFLGRLYLHPPHLSPSCVCDHNNGGVEAAERSAV